MQIELMGAAMVGQEAYESSIRLGLVIEADAPFEAWHERLLGELNALSGVRLVRIYLDAAPRPPVFMSALSFSAFRFDNLVTRRKGVEMRPDWRLAARAFAGPEEPDIVIDLRAAANAVAGAAREVWSVDFLRGPASPERLGMRVAASGAGAFSIALERVTPAGFEQIDQAVCTGRRSAVRNLEQAEQVIAAMILRTLRARIAGITNKTREPLADGLVLQPADDDHALLFAGKFVAYAAARGADTLSKRISAWSGTLAPHFKLYHATGTPLDFSPGAAQALADSGKNYLADPFLFRQGGRLWAFFEIFDYRQNTGSIGVAELTGNGLGPIETVLSGGGHLSYPQVFAHGEEIYMMPECCARRRVEIWRAVRFPYEWELAATALEGAIAVDSNLHFDGGKWWLITNVAFDPSIDAGLELSVFEADGPLLKNLAAHACNPVIADARYARNGGRIFRQGGKLYRPAQSLEFGKYGYGLYIMEILRLSHDEYEERPVRFIRGCHHLDSNGADIIFDMRRGVSLEQAAQSGKPA